MRTPNFSIFTGTANPELATAIALTIDHRVSPCVVERFPDGEISVHLDEPVRGHPVFIIQSTSPPVTESLFQLLALVDACRRAAAGRVTAVVPYFGYARADKRHARREPITASMVANLFQAVGLNHLVTLDLHAAQIEGFFHLPVDNLTAVPTLCDELKHRLPAGTVVVSPDEGRVKMASDYAQRLGTDVAVLHKQRESGTETKIIKVIGDVRDRPCLIIDDMISTGGTIERAIAALLIAAEEQKELARRELAYRGHDSSPKLRGKIVILVDDGIATGSTMRAAVRAVRLQQPARIVVAVPTAAPSSYAQLKREADEIVALMTPEDFYAVGQWYEDFSQTTDEEVTRLLASAGHGAMRKEGAAV